MHVDRFELVDCGREDRVFEDRGYSKCFKTVLDGQDFFGGLKIDGAMDILSGDLLHADGRTLGSVTMTIDNLNWNQFTMAEVCTVFLQQNPKKLQIP